MFARASHACCIAQVCSQLIVALLGAGLTEAQLARTTCKRVPTGIGASASGGNDAVFAMQFPMEAATPRALAAMQLSPPRAHISSFDDDGIIACVANAANAE